MNLNTLSSQYNETMGKCLGFVIKSIAHPERLFKVEYKLSTGKYAITRIDTGESFLVLGTEDRYEFPISLARIREVKVELSELVAQKSNIETRMAELKNSLELMGDVG